MAIIHKVVDFTKRHPWEVGGGAAAIVLLFLFTRGSSTATTAVDPATALKLAQLQSSTQLGLAADQVAAASNPSMYAAQAAEAQAQYAANASNTSILAQVKASLASTAASITNTNTAAKEATTLNAQNTAVQTLGIKDSLTQALASIAGSTTIAQAGDAVQSLSIGDALQGLLASIAGSTTIAQAGDAVQSLSIGDALQGVVDSIAGSQSLLSTQLNANLIYQSNANSLTLAQQAAGILGNLDFLNASTASTIAINNNVEQNASNLGASQEQEASNLNAATTANSIASYGAATADSVWKSATSALNIETIGNSLQAMLDIGKSASVSDGVEQSTWQQFLASIIGSNAVTA
jgi:hypothetical protein